MTHIISLFVLKRKFTCRREKHRYTSHHAISSQEVRDDLSVNVVHQASWTLVVISSINKKLLASVLINQGADLESKTQTSLLRKSSRLTYYEIQNSIPEYLKY